MTRTGATFMMPRPRKGYRGTAMSENQPKTSVMTIPHERTPSHRTEFANGVATMGPFADGLFRLTFFRDAMAPLTEEFDVAEGNKQMVSKGRVSSETKGRLIREDVFTLIVSPDVLEKMGSDMERAGIAATAAAAAAAIKPQA